ncbi:hypothetical protein AG1IA_02002 [Rhizoctonia solani AG-1 IA]|uniref:Uncharacterized protein n=1 Tax=Thanatephorus cucumeris (strain AG1-IA) TaxID=983506 RepID=L8X0V8_THACA|nr:hypothetical protein AG1IA_02002 [Rhizoctonia solani AG-1 IA]
MGGCLSKTVITPQSHVSIAVFSIENTWAGNEIQVGPLDQLWFYSAHQTSKPSDCPSVRKGCQFKINGALENHCKSRDEFMNRQNVEYTFLVCVIIRGPVTS